MSKMRAMVVPKAGAKLELVERELPEPGKHEVRVRVQACGVCHSDALTVKGLMPGLKYPRVPGHEVIGTLDALGADVEGWTLGTRIGVGWSPGTCGYCAPCRHADAFDFPAQINAKFAAHAFAHFFTQRLDLSRFRVAGVDQEVTMFF